MEQSLLLTVVLPASLFLIMLGMGLSLVLDDFRRVLTVPKAFAIGVFCQMVLLPLVGFGVVAVFDMGNPEVAMGLIVLSLCPGGVTSNMFSFLAKGDVALSITLTAVVSVISPFTIPLITAFAMSRMMGNSAAFSLSIPKTIITLLVITVVPVAIGMAINKKWPNAAKKADKTVKIASLVILFAIIGALMKRQWAELPGFFAQTGLAALTLNVVTMALGYVAARLGGLARKQQITIGMEVGIQNGTTALAVTGTLIGSTAMTIAPAIYSLIMFATGGLFALLMNLGGSKQEATPEAAAS
jgi:BASS family bile acid:Na+ symporter